MTDSIVYQAPIEVFESGNVVQINQLPLETWFSASQGIVVNTASIEIWTDYVPGPSNENKFYLFFSM